MNRRCFQRGVAAIELVFSLPVFIVIFLALLYYGYALVVYQVAIEAASAGAQAAVAQSPLKNDYSDSVQSAAQTAAKRVALGLLEENEVSDDELGCIGAPEIPQAGEEYQYRVSINFSACKTLQMLSVKFPLLGTLPPALGGDFEVFATAQL